MATFFVLGEDSGTPKALPNDVFSKLLLVGPMAMCCAWISGPWLWHAKNAPGSPNAARLGTAALNAVYGDEGVKSSTERSNLSHWLGCTTGLKTRLTCPPTRQTNGWLIIESRPGLLHLTNASLQPLVSPCPQWQA